MSKIKRGKAKRMRINLDVRKAALVQSAAAVAAQATVLEAAKVQVGERLSGLAETAQHWRSKCGALEQANAHLTEQLVELEEAFVAAQAEADQERERADCEREWREDAEDEREALHSQLVTAHILGAVAFVGGALIGVGAMLTWG